MTALPIALFTASLPGPVDRALGVARDLGLRGVQIPAGPAGLDPATLDAAARTNWRRKLADHHLVLTALCGDVPGHGFTRADGLAQRIAATCAIIDLAADLGTAVVSAHVGVITGNPLDPRAQLMASSLKTIGDHALKRGVRYAIETGPETAAVLRSFLDRLAHPGLGVNLDPANLKMVQDEDGAAVTRTLAPWTVHVHAKDGIHHQPCNAEEVYASFADGGFAELVARTGALFTETPLGAGQVDWKAVIRELKASGYRGWLTIEREAGNDPVGDITAAVRFLTTIQESRS